MTLQIFLSPRQKNQQATKQLNSSSHKKTDGSSDRTTGRRMWAWRRTRGNRMVVGWLELIPYLGYWTVAPSFHVGTCLLAKMCVSQTKIETKQQPAVCKTDNTSCNICHVCNSRGSTKQTWGRCRVNCTHSCRLKLLLGHSLRTQGKHVAYPCYYLCLSDIQNEDSDAYSVQLYFC